MSGTKDENSAAKNSQELLQQVQAGSEQNIEESVREAENLRDKELTPAQKMDLLLRGQSPAQLKREIEKLRKEAAKYRTSSKKEEEQKLALQTRAQEIQNELDALKNAHRTLAVIRKLDKAGCIKSELVAKDIPAYCIAGGNPCRIIRKRFDDALTDYLLQLKWWDWDPDRIFRNMEALCSGNPEKIRAIPDAAPPAK